MLPAPLSEEHCHAYKVYLVADCLSPSVGASWSSGPQPLRQSPRTPPHCTAPAMDQLHCQHTTQELPFATTAAHPASSTPVRTKRNPTRERRRAPAKDGTVRIPTSQKRSRGQGPFSIERSHRDSVLVVTNSDRFGRTPNFEEDVGEHDDAEEDQQPPAKRKTPYENIQGVLRRRSGGTKATSKSGAS